MPNFLTKKRPKIALSDWPSEIPRPSHVSMKLSGWILRLKDSSTNANWRQLLCHYLETTRSGLQVSDPTVFPLILKACSNISFSSGKSVHGFLIKKGFESHTSIGNSTIDFYTKSGHLHDALSVFNLMGNRDSVSWNVMVYGYLNHGDLGDGLWCFEEARLAGFEPNYSTLVMVIKACRDLGAKREGKKFHGFMIRGGFMAIRSVRNSLTSFYAEFEMDCARKMFDEMFERDVVAWSVMIKGYVYSGDAQIGLRMFVEMSSEVGVEPDGVTTVSVLKACASLGDAYMGKMVHGFAIRRGLDRDLFVGNSLIDVYSKCEEPDSAFEVFKDMPRRNNVSWNSIVSGFIINEKHLEALMLFGAMGKRGIEADEVSIVNILQVLKHFDEGLHCKSVHCVMIRRGYESNEMVLNSLLDAYAKCNLIEYARDLFDGIKRRNEVSWSTMIAGFAQLGRPEEAIFVFQEMLQAKEKPNAITIINLLKACSVLAELKRSKWAHAVAIRRGFSGEVAVATAILDMYSKCGAIDASRRVFGLIREKNIVSWSAMIAAYGMNGLASKALTLHAEMKLQGLKPNAVTSLCVFSACSHGGLVDEGLAFFNTMARDHGVEPELEHYSSVVDMLGRAGRLDSAMDFIKKIPKGLEAGAKAWGSLLSACKSYGNSKLGSEAASRVLELEPLNSTGYLMASSVYAAGGLWVEAANMRRLVKERRVEVVAGYSAVQFGNTSCKFVAGDYSHSRADDIYFMVELLHSCMKMNKKIDFDVTEDPNC